MRNPSPKPSFKISLKASLPSPIYIYVGRVAIEKNIKAFLDIQIEGSKIVVGDGPQFNELKKKYKDVLFTGMLKEKEVASYLAASDVFVFPSKTDTFGIVIIEALAAGVPKWICFVILMPINQHWFVLVFWFLVEC